MKPENQDEFMHGWCLGNHAGHDPVRSGQVLNRDLDRVVALQRNITWCPNQLWSGSCTLSETNSQSPSMFFVMPACSALRCTCRTPAFHPALRHVEPRQGTVLTIVHLMYCYIVVWCTKSKKINKLFYFSYSDILLKVLTSKKDSS